MNQQMRDYDELIEENEIDFQVSDSLEYYGDEATDDDIQNYADFAKVRGANAALSQKQSLSGVVRGSRQRFGRISKNGSQPMSV